MLKTLISENITIIFVRFLINGLFLFRYEEEFDGFGVRHIGIGHCRVCNDGHFARCSEGLAYKYSASRTFYFGLCTIGVCVGAPGMVLVARTRPLKHILLGLMVIYICGNLCAAASVNYWMMLMMRFISGLPHGAFFGVGSIVAERVADKGKSSQAVALMVSGMTIANLFGVPLGTFMSNIMSWRIPFLFNGVWGLITLFYIWKWVPSLPALPDTGLKGQFRFLKNLAPWLLIFTTMFGNGGIFCWYSYVTPLMTHVAGFSENSMTFIMVLAGLSMTVGNLMGGKFSDQYGAARVVKYTQVIMASGLLAIFFAASVSWLAVILMCICTAGLFAVSAPQQLLLLRNSRGGEMMGAACVQVAFNLGNAIGAYAGGLPIDAGLGYRYPALVGVFIVLIGFVAVSLYSKRESASLSKI